MISTDKILDAYVSTIQSANRWIITTIAFTFICVALIDQGFHNKKNQDEMKETALAKLENKIRGIERNNIVNRYHAGVYDAMQTRATLRGAEENLYKRIEKAYQDYPPAGDWHPKTEDSLRKSLPPLQEMINELKKELKTIQSTSTLSDSEIIEIDESLQTKTQGIRDYYEALHNLIKTYEALKVEKEKPAAKVELPVLPTPIGGISLGLAYALILFMLANCFALSWINMKSRRLHKLVWLLSESGSGSLQELYETHPLPIWAHPVPQEIRISASRMPLPAIIGIAIQLVWLVLIFWLASYCFTYNATQELAMINSLALNVFVIGALLIVTCSSVVKIVLSSNLAKSWNNEKFTVMQQEIINPQRRNLILGGISYLSIFSIGLYLSKIAQSDKSILPKRQLISSNASERKLVEQEVAMLKEVESSPLQIWLYDRLVKFYGKHARYDDIYSFLLSARQKLEKYKPEPWYAKRKQTTLRLLKERILRVEAIRKSKNLSIREVRSVGRSPGSLSFR